MNRAPQARYTLNMLDTILSPQQQDLLRDEKDLLTEVARALERNDVATDERGALTDSLRQLDELFLLVIVGEFNAGKSALINALLGRELLAEGVTPTTAKIHLVSWGETENRETVDAVSERLTAPVPILRQLSLVDTPGTNALDRSHEALTSDYVPRADLVLFVTSADRPFSESERVFLEHIREWGKKVVVAVNKVDILKTPGEVSEVLDWVRSNGMRLLGSTPEVFPGSILRFSCKPLPRSTVAATFISKVSMSSPTNHEQKLTVARVASRPTLPWSRPWTNSAKSSPLTRLHFVNAMPQ